MKRFARLTWAWFHAQAYSLTRGMWRGESITTGHARDKSCIYIASTTGNMLNGTLKVVRVFWDEMVED